MPQRLLPIAEPFVQPRRVEVRVGQVWCEAQAALGRALMLSGQRTRQVPQVREAVEAYRTALDGASDEVATQIRLELNLGLG